MSSFTPKEYQRDALNSVEAYFRVCQRLGTADYAFQETTKELWGRKSDFAPVPGLLEEMPYFCPRVPPAATVKPSSREPHRRSFILTSSASFPMAEFS